MIVFVLFDSKYILSKLTLSALKFRAVQESMALYKEGLFVTCGVFILNAFVFTLCNETA